MPGTLCHFEIITNDVLKAEKFYTELFGWTISRAYGDDYLFVHTGQEPDGAIGKADEELKPGNGVCFYFEVDDCAAYCDKAVSLGGSQIKEKAEISGHGWYALFGDLDGNCIGLFEALKK